MLRMDMGFYMEVVLWPHTKSMSKDPCFLGFLPTNIDRSSYQDLGACNIMVPDSEEGRLSIIANIMVARSGICSE